MGSCSVILITNHWTALPVSSWYHRGGNTNSEFSQSTIPHCTLWQSSYGWSLTQASIPTNHVSGNTRVFSHRFRNLCPRRKCHMQGCNLITDSIQLRNPLYPHNTIHRSVTALTDFHHDRSLCMKIGSVTLFNHQYFFFTRNLTRLNSDNEILWQ